MSRPPVKLQRYISPAELEDLRRTHYLRPTPSRYNPMQPGRKFFAKDLGFWSSSMFGINSGIVAEVNKDTVNDWKEDPMSVAKESGSVYTEHWIPESEIRIISR